MLAPVFIMEFEFAKYTEVTDYAFKVNPNYKNEGFIRFFICPDVWDFWFVRILEGYNEEYDEEEGSFILERNKIEMHRKGKKWQSTDIQDLQKTILTDFVALATNVSGLCVIALSRN